MAGAARLNDMHECPMESYDNPPIPHIGGPIDGSGEQTVIINGMPASVVGDTLVCVGPPDEIVEGSQTVFIGGRPAARIGDGTAHGGVIITGSTNVIIGD